MDKLLEWWEKNGWKVGDQTPWATKSQRLVWDYVDDYETIEREFQAYLNEQG